MSKPRAQAVTRAQRNIDWIETHCVIPEGKDVGKPVRLRDWQQDILRKIYDNPHGTRQAIISMPRKNAKTALISFLLLLHLCGPEARQNSQLYSAAQSKDQAATVYKLAAKIVRMSVSLRSYVVPRDTVKELACPELGTLYAALSAEKSTAHGKSPIFAVHDELGQVKGPVSELYEAVETGMGAHAHPMSIIISTQAPTDADLLSTLIDDAKQGIDPTTVLVVHAAPIEADPFDEATLRACNPAWGDFLNADEVLRTMEKAKAMPSQEPSYRNLHLNQRVDASAPFVSRSAWMACRGDVVADWSGRVVYCGFDLAKAAGDMTAFVMVTPVDGRWHVRPYYWLPYKGLAEKARQDKAPYVQWHDDGFLETTPGAAVDYDHVAVRVAELLDEVEAHAVGYDPYNWSHMRVALIRAGVSPDLMPEIGQPKQDLLFRPFRQGMITMGPAVTNLESAILDQKIVVPDHPILDDNARNATTEGDRVGNRMLSKSKSHGRIDGLVALAMAMSVAGTWQEEPSDKSFWEAA